MYSIIKLLLILSIVLADSLDQLKNCETNIDEAEICARKLIFTGDRERIIPKTEQDMVQHCSSFLKNLKCLEKHSKCYRLFPRQIFNTAIHNIKKQFKKTCQTQKGRKEFLKHAKCIRNSQAAESVHKCSDKWTVTMQMILNKMKAEEHFTATCCSIAFFRKCLFINVDNLCRNITGPETAKYIDRTVTDALGEFSELICSRSNSIESCSNNFPIITNKLKDISLSDVPRQNTSALFHFLRIAVKYETN